MNETKSDQKQPAPPKPDPTAKFTRVPIRSLRFAGGAYSMPPVNGNSSSVESNVQCVAKNADDTRHWLCNYVVELAAYELTWAGGDPTGPHYVPRELVSQFTVLR